MPATLFTNGKVKLLLAACRIVEILLNAHNLHNKYDKLDFAGIFVNMHPAFRHEQACCCVLKARFFIQDLFSKVPK